MVTASPARVPAVRRGGAGARRDRARAVVATLCRRCPPGGGRPFSPQVVVAGTGRPVACVAAIGLFAAVRGPLRRTPRAEARPTVVAVTDAGRSPRARGRVRSDRPRRRRRGRAQGGFGRWPGLPDGVREAAPPAHLPRMADPVPRGDARGPGTAERTARFHQERGGRAADRGPGPRMPAVATGTRSRAEHQAHPPGPRVTAGHAGPRRPGVRDTWPERGRRPRPAGTRRLHPARKSGRRGGETARPGARKSPDAPRSREMMRIHDGLRYCFVIIDSGVPGAGTRRSARPWSAGGPVPVRVPAAPGACGGVAHQPTGGRWVKKLTFETFVRYFGRILAGLDTVSESPPGRADETIGGTVFPGLGPGNPDDERWPVARDGEAG